MSRDRRGFKRVAGQLITGNKVRYFVRQTNTFNSVDALQMMFSILSQLKGKLLVKCELPEDLQTETNDILGWVLPFRREKEVEVSIQPWNFLLCFVNSALDVERYSQLSQGYLTPS